MGSALEDYASARTRHNKDKNVYSPTLKVAVGRRHLLVRCVNDTKELSLVVRQRIHRLLRQVEAVIRMINSQHVNRATVICDLPACATVGRVPPRDGLRAADIREVLQRAEGRVPFALEAVRAIGASDDVKGIALVVVGVVVRDTNGKGRDGEQEQGGEGGEELHVEEGARQVRLQLCETVLV